MAYSADSFTALEVPTLAKMNKLWSNDASFNDGTGIADSAIISRHYAALSITSAKIANDTIASNKHLKEITTGVSFASGWSSLTGHTVKATRKGGFVYLSGIATKAGAAWATGDTLLTIPSGYRLASGILDQYMIYLTPSTNTFSASGSVNVFGTDAASTPGQITARTAGSAGQWISLYGICYPCETY